MDVIIAGSRTILDYDELLLAIKQANLNINKILCGKAQGVDTLGEQYALEHNIPINYYPADWDTYGKKAGYMRNEIMAKNANALIVLWDGKSKGTRHMINLANRYKLNIFMKIVVIRRR